MNFEKMNDFIISKRIIYARKSLGLTQEAFCDRVSNKVSLDKFRLSSLENGKRHAKKNPHFLTEAYIELYSELLDITQEEFLFGNHDDKKNLIRIILLAIFMNADSKAYSINELQVEQNPIIDPQMESDEEFFRLAMHNLNHETQKEYRELSLNHFLSLQQDNKEDMTNIIKSRQKVSSILEKIDSFFFNRRFWEIYQHSMNGDSIFSEPSSMILKCLFGEIDFSIDFFNRIINSETITSGGILLADPETEHFYIDNYLENLGSFSASAINWKESSFIVFIKAFNNFLDLHIETFIDFFIKHIFSKNLKQLSNKYINDLFTSSKFILLLNNIYIKDQFLTDRMIGHNFSRSMIQKLALVKENSLKLKKIETEYSTNIRKLEDFYDLDNIENQQYTYNLSKYLYDLENITSLFSKGKQKNNRVGLFLPSYFDVQPL